MKSKLFLLLLIMAAVVLTTSSASAITRKARPLVVPLLPGPSVTPGPIQSAP